MRKTSNIPDTSALPVPVKRVIDPIKEQLEVITGRRVTALTTLPTISASATLAEVVTAYNLLVQAHNELVNRIQQ